MGQGRLVVRYWWSVAAQALQQTYTFIRHHLLLQAALFAMGSGVFLFWKGKDALTEEGAVFAAFILAPVGALAFLLTLWNIISTPWRRETALVERNKALGAQLHVRVTKAAVAKALTEMYHKGKELHLEKLAGEDAYPDWKKRVDEWTRSSLRGIGQLISPGQAELWSVTYVRWTPSIGQDWGDIKRESRCPTIAYQCSSGLPLPP